MHLHIANVKSEGARVSLSSLCSHCEVNKKENGPSGWAGALERRRLQRALFIKGY